MHCEAEKFTKFLLSRMAVIVPLKLNIALKVVSCQDWFFHWQDTCGVCWEAD